MARRWTVTQADVIQWFEDQPDEPRYHAAWFDPPYFLGSIAKRFGKPNAAPPKWAAAANKWGDNGENNPYSRTSKGFMGQTWDGFESALDFQNWITALGKGLLKVLYPGAVIAVCGSSRTWHRLAVGLEDAGFEVFDSIIWMYGSGWPKGKNVQQAIEKLAGVQRDGSKKHQMSDDMLLGAALAWKGYNTVLKPAYEPIILCRAPRRGRVADNALEHGTGALNIDAARIPVIGGDYKASFDRVSLKASRTQSVYDRQARPPAISEPNQLGRYPANIIMTHSESCRFMGYEQVRSVEDTDNKVSGYNGITMLPSSTPPQPTPHYADGDGLETVESWDCAPDCPIGQLNAQSGVTRSQGGTTRTASRHMDFTFNQEMPREIRGDSGGASRFFYTGKAGTWERCAGLPARSKHPTMKPIMLTEYIARLLLPPPFEDGEKRRLLIPCSGVGSEMIGAVLAGWDEVSGIELGAEYVQDCIMRLEWWERFHNYEQAKRRYNKIVNPNKTKPNQRNQPDESGESKTQLPLF